MTSYKNEKQYTTLIHAGENVTIEPPGFINAEGGGGVSPDDLKAPLQLYNKSNEEIAFLTADGDMYLDGTVYINGNTDVQDLSPIFDIDIIGDYTNGTFTSSQTFAQVTEAMETGHTLIARDTNGFVYTQSSSEFDPETTDTITFSSVQPDGLYYLHWTGASRTIGFININSGSGSDNKVFVFSVTRNDTTFTTSTNISELVNAYENNKTIIAIQTYENDPYRNIFYLSDASHDEGDYSNFTFASPNMNYDGVREYMRWTYDYTAEEDGENKTFYTQQFYQVNRLYTNGSAFYEDETMQSPVDDSGSLSPFLEPQYGNFGNVYELYYIENGNYHLLHKQMRTGTREDFEEDPSTTTYGFSSIEGFSTNTLIVYNLLISFEYDQEEEFYAAIPSLNTITINA